ncbi:hypothetical protein [Ornithinimicrobium cryptoxanthini]|uniref:Uncharacterized protein n=1 Tax=Ornithinimicrobium cryptoxanthini TaxID=2934161 RepID=A0ABY4YJX8_9MICO|nr:hypothetical protein [Ornithinimicrobium cryptoxanthini]USQ76924.1 hypothetical protein NF557_03075 [Ornithinimicrobium cryptoxanthini]
MSIAGGLFNSNNKQENVGDTKSTSDGGGTDGDTPAVDLTTSIPGFDDVDADDSGSIVIGTDDDTQAWVDEAADSSAVDDLDVNSSPEEPLDLES